MPRSITSSQINRAQTELKDRGLPSHPPSPGKGGSCLQSSVMTHGCFLSKSHCCLSQFFSPIWATRKRMTPKSSEGMRRGSQDPLLYCTCHGKGWTNKGICLGPLTTNLFSHHKRNLSDVPEDLGQGCLGWKSTNSLQSVTTEEYYKNPRLWVKLLFTLGKQMTILCYQMQPLLGWMVAATSPYRALEEFRTPEAPNPSLKWNCRVIKQREFNYPNCNLASTMDLTPLFLEGKKISTVFEVQNLINYLRKRILFLKENS